MGRVGRSGERGCSGDNRRSGYFENGAFVIGSSDVGRSVQEAVVGQKQIGVGIAAVAAVAEGVKSGRLARGRQAIHGSTAVLSASAGSSVEVAVRTFDHPRFG